MRILRQFVSVLVLSLFGNSLLSMDNPLSLMELSSEKAETSLIQYTPTNKELGYFEQLYTSLYKDFFVQFKMSQLCDMDDINPHLSLYVSRDNSISNTNQEFCDLVKYRYNSIFKDNSKAQISFELPVSMKINAISEEFGEVSAINRNGNQVTIDLDLSQMEVDSFRTLSTGSEGILEVYTVLKNEEVETPTIIKEDFYRPNMCQLTTSLTQSTCLDNNDGTFTTSYDVTVSWMDGPTEDIEVIVNGVVVQTILSGNVSPQVVSIALAADGTGQDTILTTFSITTTCADTIFVKSPNPCPNNVTICSNASNCLGGNAFEDFNFNGEENALEPGVQGVQVVVYDCANTAIDTTWTDSEGDWQVCSLTDGETYRVEFILPENIACWAKPTHTGTENGTDVQFLTAPACTKFGISDAKGYCEEDPFVIIPCFSDGAYTGGNSGEAAIVKLRESADGHDFAGTAKTGDFEAVVLATHNDVGAVYGVAWQPTKERYYLSAFHKRYVGYGPDGPDAIYQYDLDGNKIGTINLDVVLATSNSAGSDVHDFTTAGVGDPHPGEVYDLGIGESSFDGVGKLSFGDIEMSDDDKTLYIINLFDKKIYALDVSSGNAASTTVTQSWDTPDETSAGRHRPFALAFHQGKLWVGSVDENGSNAYVHSFLPTSTSFNLELTIPLDYDRQAYINDAYNAGALSNWNAWATNTSITYGGITVGPTWEVGYPQPILSDIEFASNGDMVLGFRDRFGDQSGAGRFFNAAETQETFAVSAGDILKACFLSGNFVLETGVGSCAGTGGVSPSGPGGKEFYSWDLYNFEDPWSPIKPDITNPGTGYVSGAVHWETTQGALLQLKGKPYIMTTAMDPFNDYSGGVLKFNNTTGGREGVAIDSSNLADLVGGYTLFDTGEYPPTPGNISFGKANGLGDLEAACAPAPIEIGNYVWCDSISNGIQDACEKGVDSLMVQLYSANGTLVGQDTTLNGNYYFNQNNVDTTGLNPDGSPASGSWTGLNYNSKYYLVYGNDQYENNAFYVGSDVFNGLTTANVNSNGNDNVDSDVDSIDLSTAIGDMPAGYPVLCINTDGTGCGDHRYDVGLLCSIEPLECPCPTTYSLCWDDSGFNEPPNANLSNFPWIDTMENMSGTGIDMAITLFQPARDGGSDTAPQQSYVSPGERCGCTFDTEFGSYLSCGEVFRNWSNNDDIPDTIIISFSEPIRIPNWGFGGFRVSGASVGNQVAIASFTFYDGPNATGNKVVSSLADPGGRGQINTGDPLVAAINEFQDQGAQETELYNGTYYYEGQNNIRGWTMLDMGGAVVHSIMWTQFVAEANLSPKDYVSVIPSSLSNSGYITSLDFEKCNCTYDYGDLPDIADGTTGVTDYETYDSTGGPNHQIIPGLFLGDTIDFEIDGFPNALAVGDDSDNVDDEDGISILPSLNIVPGGTIKLPINLTNTTGDTAYLEAWIDWNGDGDFDEPNEMVVDLKDEEDGVFPNYLTISVPANVVNQTLIGFRIRLSNEDNMTPYGRVNSGEIEDYLIIVGCPQPICLPIEIQINKE